MTVWQFLSTLPVAIWWGLLGLLGLIILFVFGGAVVAFLVTLIRGGKVHVGKDGVNAETEEESEASSEEAKK